MKFCVVTFCDCQKMVLDMTVSDLGWTLCVLSNLYIFCVWVSACVQGLLQIKILLFMVEITLYVNRLRICNDPMANNVKFRVFTKKMSQLWIFTVFDGHLSFSVRVFPRISFFNKFAAVLS